MGFFILETNTVSAMPELEALMKDTMRPRTSNRAMNALASIGEPAIPLLRTALADTNRSDRVDILSAIGCMHGPQSTNVTLPILYEALNDHELAVRQKATNFVRYFRAEILTNVPPE